MLLRNIYQVIIPVVLYITHALYFITCITIISPGYQIFRTFLILRAKLFPLGSWGKNSVLALSYWYQAQAAQDGAADIIIAKFFDVGYFTASGADPAYRR